MIRNTNESLLDEIDDTLYEWENRFDYNGNSIILEDCSPSEELSENIINTTPVLHTPPSLDKFRTGSWQVFSQFARNFVLASAR